MTELHWDAKGIWAEDDRSIQRLHKNFFGRLEKGRIWLNPEEAMYVVSLMNGTCEKKGKPAGFNEIASFYLKGSPRLIIRYNALRDWRDRGLVIKGIEEVKLEKPQRAKPRIWKKYPSKETKALKIKAEAYWYPESLFSVIDDVSVGEDLFNKHWFGQLGVYRQERGDLLKLNFLETIFLSRHFGMGVVNAATGKKVAWSSILSAVQKKREYAKRLYEVYEDWRLRGYVVKTGFKFGSHFRIYFPGASPTLSPSKSGESPGEWMHSKHVLHVFPKEEKLLISEWARAVRVAHSVKKTFLLSVPELTEKDMVDYPVDFLGYRRRKSGGNWVRENPKEDKPRYIIVAFSEDDHIGGVELASLLKKAEDMDLRLVLSITDRETSITYYLLNKITLPGSDKEYYEIEWMKP